MIGPKAGYSLQDSARISTGRGALWALLFGNLIIGTGVLLPAGQLTAIMTDFTLTPARAGLLIFVGGLTVGIGAPVLAWATASIDRRLLLMGGLALYAAGHALSALASDFNLLLGLRAVTIVGAAIFTPQAAATVGLIVPPDRRAGAIAFIFIGWSLASVAGIPLGNLLGEHVGWRATCMIMALASAAVALAVYTVLGKGLRVSPIRLATWRSVFASPALLVVLLVTLLSMSGQFTLFSYVTPVLKTAYGASPEAIAFAFLLVGATGVAGNYAAARLAAPLGVELAIFLLLAAIAAGLAVIAIFFGAYAAFIAGGCLWGLGSFASNSLQQSRLVALAPTLAPATVALNTSVVYLGQSLGSATGGAIIAHGPSPAMAWAGSAFLAVAMGLSVLVKGPASRPP